MDKYVRHYIVLGLTMIVIHRITIIIINACITIIMCLRSVAPILKKGTLLSKPFD